MKLFLSYPSAERPLAERLVLALEAEGHEVFFDRHDLAAGDSFHRPLREAIQGADAMLFLLTPAAIAPGSYVLAELEIARAHWPRPAGRVLPVVVAPVAVAALPPYLSAVTLLQPRGDLVAETVAAVSRLDGGGRARRRRLLAAGGGVLVLAAAGGWAWQRQRAEREALAHEAAARAQAADDAAAALRALLPPGPPGPTGLALRERATALQQVLQQALQHALQDAPGGSAGLPARRRIADLRAHIGAAEFLRQRSGDPALPAPADPAQPWQAALAADPANVYAHAMAAQALMPRQLDRARRHFEQALAEGRERPWVRQLQLASSLTLDDAAATYAVGVADAMRRGGEPLTPAQRQRLWTYAFGTRTLDAALRDQLFAAVPAAELLATGQAVFGAGDLGNATPELRQFNLALLQANAGQRDAARAGFSALAAELQRQGASGRLVDETRRALAALAPVAGR